MIIPLEIIWITKVIYNNAKCKVQNAELSKSSSLTEFTALAVNNVLIIFGRGVYVDKKYISGCKCGICSR